MAHILMFKTIQTLKVPPEQTQENKIATSVQSAKIFTEPKEAAQ